MCVVTEFIAQSTAEEQQIWLHSALRKLGQGATVTKAKLNVR